MKLLWRILKVIAALVGLIVGFVIVLLSIDSWQMSHPKAYGVTTRTRLRHAQWTAWVHYQLHGSFPTNAEHLGALMREAEALSGNPPSNTRGCFDKKGRLVDAWRRPVAVELDADGSRLVIRSFGPNGKDDGGTNDDMVETVIPPSKD